MEPKMVAAQTLALAPGLALIFDLDGVVVDSMPVHQQAWQRYVESLGLDATGIAARMHGRRNDEIFRDLLGPGADSREIFEHGAAKERLFRQMMRERLHEYLVPGIAEWLDRTAGAPVALATNAERPNIDFVLDGAGLRRHFQVIVDGSQVSRPKPSPDVYLRAARELGIAPCNCIVFEDSPVGVAAARAAGMRVVGILTYPSPLAGVLFSAPNFLTPGLDYWLSTQTAD
jgi:beta-phosphoglucomutase